MNTYRHISLVLGMERYNAELFQRIKSELRTQCPNLRVHVFFDNDVIERPKKVEAAISVSDIVFTALMVLDDVTNALIEMIKKHEPKFVFAFESLPPLMMMNKVGTYHFSGGKGEMPKPVKALGKILGGGREEDAFYGYVQMQRLANRVMKFLPENFGGEKVHDARLWMTVSSYWSNSGEENVRNMLLFMAEKLLHLPVKSQAPKEIGTMGFYHPEYYHETKEFFPDLKHYLKWEKKTGRDKGNKPKVGLLLPRKHLLTGQTYADEVIEALEAQGLRVYACYAMGIELHIAVRTFLKEAGIELLLNLFGFPLVGGPAGSTKTGLAHPAASEILSDLNAPYIVTQPLFLQTKESWKTYGVNPFQAMVIYSLPEMDGAICPVVLGALENNAVKLDKSRLNRLCKLVARWLSLKHKRNAEKKVAIVLYNYPPNQGKLATAALLDVPRSLVNFVRELQQHGYNTGDFLARYAENPDAIVHDLAKSIEADTVTETASMQDYMQWISPKEQDRIEARWGKAPGDIAVTSKDRFIIGGLRFGNLYIGAQPQLFIQGDPMRLLFDKENTPHHQFVMFYRWIVNRFGADALVHFGMHGTAEWMPGLQLGLTDECWSDILLGELPQFYIYPMNNPSEANIAKRRGYATIISHAIPPYARAGLYKEFQALRDLLGDFENGRDFPELRDAIMQKAALLNLHDDVPPSEDFAKYASELAAYLKEMENRLICGDLHVLGENPDKATQVELITEALKNQSELALLDFAATCLNTEPYSMLAQRAKAGDKDAQLKKEKLEAFCKKLIEEYVIEEKPIGHTLEV
jgi:magnesium chelatase subunit H